VVKITGIETWITSIPFDMSGKPTSFGGMSWQSLDTLWVRVITDAGLEGWGEGFGHACCAATRTVLETQVGPAALGQDARDLIGLSHRLAQRFHLFGRNGPHVYAASALDIALWDIAGKAAGLPLWRLFGAAPATARPAYASLLRYGAPAEVAAACERAAARGYHDIKLHEIDTPQVVAARRALGEEPRLMVDVNCPWTVTQAIAMARRLRECDLTWLEEPVWPPEDHAGLARVRQEGGIAIAAGENASGLHDFRHHFEAGALDIAQPSVAKIGGITPMLEIAALARAFGVRLVPHAAYFGPGYLASIHLHAAVSPDGPFERLFIDLEASPYHDAVLATDGAVPVPQGPGLGVDPDFGVLRRFANGEPSVLNA
jgi:D-galactarolactone cycloisomerase